MGHSRTVVAFLGLVALAGAQTPLFQRLDGPLPGGVNNVTATGDLDGDGDVDLLAQWGTSFLVNDGNARFSGGVAAPPPLSAPAALADLNGDGLLDIVSTIYLPGATALSVAIYLNAGGLAFTGPVAGVPAIPPIQVPVSFALGDVDGDGDVDVLIGTLQWWGGHLLIPAPAILWLNNGAGGFTIAPATSLALGNLPWEQMFLRDLDNDGDLDAIFAKISNGASVVVAINSGGTFTLAPPPGLPVGVIDLGDFNGDGFADIVAPSSTGVAVFLGSAGGFAPPVVSVLPGVLPGVGRVAAIDVNLDGLDELLFADYGSTALYATTPSGMIGAQLQSWPVGLFGPAPGSLWIQDLDGDQDRDVIVRSGTESALLMNDGAGGMVLVVGHAFPTGLSWNHRLVDLDGDGDRDLLGIQPHPSDGVATAFNDGDGYFSPGPTSPVPFIYSGNSITSWVHPFDRDGDGDADLYRAWDPNPAFGAGPFDSVYDNAGGTFTQIATIPSTGNTALLQAADFDGDGDQDLLLGKRGNGATVAGPMVYVSNLGAGGFGAPVAVGGSHATYDLDLGDFDGNGKIDAFQANFVSAGAPDPCVVYLNSGAGTVTAVVQGFSGQFVAAADLNGDGMTDLVVDGQVWMSSGGGAFTPGLPLPSALVAPPVLADVDLDGDLDLVETPGTIMLNLGGGAFGAPQSYLTRSQGPQYWDSIVPEAQVADLDRDGDPDIASSGIILTNTTRQIARGAIPRPGRPASVDLYGTPGGAWFLFGSSATTSIPLAPWGTVLIDPALAQPPAVGTFVATGFLAGTATVGTTLPANPGLIGLTAYLQAIDAAQMRLTNRLTLTVMGY